MGKDFLHDCKVHTTNVLQNTALSDKCSYKAGGTAEFYIEPTSSTELQKVLGLAYSHGLRVTILGEGSNVLPPDSVLAGLVICTRSLHHESTNLSSNSSPLACERNKISGIEIFDEHVRCAAGVSVRALCCNLANAGKRGLDFIYGMPGTIGGALWMNARCYGSEISDVLRSAKGFDLSGNPWSYESNKDDFSYKQSPFAKAGSGMDIIVECSLTISSDDSARIWQDMLIHEMDRRIKGHYIAPCAGSVFKNNRDFDNPSGKILDSLHWRNRCCGEAQVNPYHANIIINTGSARARDIRQLGDQMWQSVKDTYGMDLEYELVFLGDETQWKN